MDADELSRLLRDAERRYFTLSCELTVLFHPAVAAKAERQRVDDGEVTLVGVSRDEAFRDWDDLGDKVIQHRALVWVSRPDGYREHDFDEDYPQLLVRDGTTWWSRDGADPARSGSSADGEQPAAAIGRYEMCVTPEPLNARLEFQVLGAGERSGREVFEHKHAVYRYPPLSAGRAGSSGST